MAVRSGDPLVVQPVRPRDVDLAEMSPPPEILGDTAVIPHEFNFNPGTSLSPAPFLAMNDEPQPLFVWVPDPPELAPDVHGLGLYQRHPHADFGPGGRYTERCQWDGAILNVGLVGVTGPYDSPEPEYWSVCPICRWEMAW
jgi:hypothetical protein